MRNKLVMTQKDLGDFLNVKQNTISAYETGDAYPTIDNLIKLAEISRVSIEWLIMGTDENTPLNKALTKDELQLLYDYRAASEPTRVKISKIVKIIIQDDETKSDVLSG